MDTSPAVPHEQEHKGQVASSTHEVLRVEVPIATRVVVTGNLFLEETNAVISRRTLRGLAEILSAWEGPGVLVLAGNVFDTERATLLAQCDDADAERTAEAPAIGSDGTIASQLASTLRTFVSSAPERKAIVLTADPAADLLPRDLFPGAGDQAATAGPAVHLATAADIVLKTARGPKTVRVEQRAPRSRGASLAGLLPPARSWSDPRTGWLYGVDKLRDPSSLPRFVTSRLFYRHLARYAWVLLLPFAVALLLRLPFVYGVLSHSAANHLIPVSDAYRARYATWGSRLAAAAVSTLIVLCVVGLAAAMVAKRTWTILRGTLLGRTMLGSPGLATNDSGRARARDLVAEGFSGLITCDTLQEELTHLDKGFFANVGANTEIVEEIPAHMGLPSAFSPQLQLSWIELEPGSEVHARLLVGHERLGTATRLERVSTWRPSQHAPEPAAPTPLAPCATEPAPGGSRAKPLLHHAALVASFPRGKTWPPKEVPSRARLRVRRLTAALLALTGVLDIASVARPPLRSHLQVILSVLPLAATQAASALIALAGLALLALARGARLGQRRSWLVSVYLVAVTTAVHLIKGGDIAAVLVGLAVEGLLVFNRRHFQSVSDRQSLRSALAILAGGAVAVTAIAAVALEAVLALHFRHALPIWSAVLATSERLVGLQSVAVPQQINHFLTPALLTTGLAIAAVALFLGTRPVIVRGRDLARSAETRARDIVRRHGSGTLDYFALREEKRYFFDRDSLVAYAVLGGVCLVAPDPIGPAAEREQVWQAFRHFADSNGWPVAVMAASEEWLPIYRETGMRDFYLGDEAIVDTRTFTLAGGANKGLRQAHHRIANHGYTIAFRDPAHLDPSTVQTLSEIMTKSRRGGEERGFSMTLGRAFDPRDTDLMLAVASGPDGQPVAFCQFAPAPGIDGYSLDLMRHDTGDHPNGLIDFILVETIFHLRDNSKHGLSLNFAAMRSLLVANDNDGISRKMERWFYRKMSDAVQIESLWRFTAKYHPDWSPRYVAYESVEHLVPISMAILRAEAVWEMPLIGRFLTPSSQASSQASGRTAPAPVPVGAKRTRRTGIRDSNGRARHLVRTVRSQRGRS